ncbi:protocadherin Fat 4-like [Ruditapes philippinarum]|uniref:protocadherin Fat 4-like n=1 Tax=Ruditapes philippinarum TaxID=129788 RepID=UPI00295AFFA6|nr:protocadherin Fat 4-like [Ruditapes philippinarum]
MIVGSKSIFLVTVIAVLFQYGECTISAWATPVIATADGGNGALATKVDDGATSATGITIAATSDASITAYTKVSQTPSDVVFAIANTGVLTISSGTLTYSTNSVYTLVISATDSAGTVTATVTLSVNDKPAFAATNYGKCIADKAAAGTTLTTLTASDAVNGGSLTYSIDSGNTDTDFEINTSGRIKTLNAMDAATVGGYKLVLHADDSSLTGTTTVWVLVADCSSGAAALLAGMMTLLMAITTMVLH